MKQTLNSLIIVGKIAYMAGTLLLFNFFFGLLFFKFFLWLIIGGVLFFILIAILFAGKKILFTSFKTTGQNSRRGAGRGEVIDVEGEVVEGDTQPEAKDAVWHDPVYCPQCHSSETRFVEPHYENSIYECNACRRRFEVEGQ